jgi:hypothetical protein
MANCISYSVDGQVAQMVKLLCFGLQVQKDPGKSLYQIGCGRLLKLRKK